MPANPDYKDLFKLLCEERVDYLLVGAHAVIHYAEPRYTKDLDILVRPTPANAAQVWRALTRFGAPLQGISAEDFCNRELVYQIGIEPNRIDVMMEIQGVDFDRAWPARVQSTYDGIPIHIIGKADLIRAKQASARPQDLLDLQRLNEKP